MPRRPSDDRAAAAVLGGILILAVLGAAILYTNAFKTPDKGAQLERSQASLLSAEMGRLAGAASSAPLSGVPVKSPVSLAPPTSDASLLKGLILDPAPPTATLEFDPSGPSLRVWHRTTPAASPTYDVGGAGGPLAVGRVTATTAGRYIAPLTYAVEAGALLQGSGDARHVTQRPDWAWWTQGNIQTLSLTVPHFAGEAQAFSDGASHAVTLSPTASYRVGGDRTAGVEVTVEIYTTHTAAWEATLREILGTSGVTYTVTPGVSVIATLVPDSGNTIALDISYVRYLVEIR